MMCADDRVANMTQGVAFAINGETHTMRGEVPPHQRNSQLVHIYLVPCSGRVLWGES